MQEHWKTYRLLPRPVPRHDVAVLSLITIELPVRRMVDMLLKVWTSKNVFDDLAWISVPDIIVCRLPFGGASCFRAGSLILEAGILPPNIANLDRVNLLVEVSLVDDRWRITMRNKCGSPQFQQLVNLSPRELGISKRELGEFETSP